ncbi:MAG: TraR/DksA C4-type zinc finger protein [Verrucomicrobiales bacterium]|nr:TraR/DksA C4-type zinc finger protein [Verrucomicrobiales bacterium]
MTPKQEQKFRKLLVNQRSELAAELAGLRKEDADTKVDSSSEVSERALLEAERAFVHRHEHDDANLLNKITLALERLENGSYETCLSCGGVIPMARLLAKPSVALCLPCQKAKDESSSGM